MYRNIFIGHHRFGLRVINSWPEKSQLPGFYFAIGIMCFFLIFEIWNITEVYHDLDELMDNLVSTIGVVLGLFKIITVRLKRRKLMMVINTIMRDWTMDTKFISDVNKENFTRSQMVSKLIIILYNSMNFTYFLRTVISYFFDSVEDRKFLAQVSFPVDGRQTPMYEIIIFFQFVTASICFNGQALVEGLLATLVLHACSKVDVVRREILSISLIGRLNKGHNNNNNNNNSILMTLRTVSKQHLKFIQFSKDIQDVFSFVSFCHIFFLTLIQVVSGYMFIDGLERGTKTVNLIHYAILTTSFLVSAGYYCIAGEYLTNQSELIFHELYNCYWYDFPLSYKRAIGFMLFKAQKPVTLTVGKFNSLSLIYLTSIMKTSFSCLSLVRAVR